METASVPPAMLGDGNMSSLQASIFYDCATAGQITRFSTSRFHCRSHSSWKTALDLSTNNLPPPLPQLDVVQTNYLTRERTGALATCDVTRVSVTSDGLWMATMEQRDDGRSTPERRLKFWEFDEAKQRYGSVLVG